MARKQQAEGSSFEQEFDLRAIAKGILNIKQYPEVKFFGPGKAKVTGTAWPDRVCAIDGLVFVLDCKTTRAKKRVNLDKGDWKNAAQFNRLVEAWEKKAVAFYLVRWAIHEEYEMYMVDSRSRWPFICERGAGLTLGGVPGWFEAMLAEVLKAYGSR